MLEAIIRIALCCVAGALFYSTSFLAESWWWAMLLIDILGASFLVFGLSSWGE